MRRLRACFRRNRLDHDLAEEIRLQIEMLVHDVRHGLRLIRKAPGFSAVAIASLAVGTAPVVRVHGFRCGLRAGLVVIQVALSLALMIGAVLMLRPAHAGRTGDPGFRRDDVLSVRCGR